jgi:hypothetical protein
MMQKPDKEMIEEMDAIIEAGTEAEHFVPIQAKPSKNLSVTYAIRLSPEEYETFTDAARARAMTLATFMRSAVHGAIAGEIDVQKAAALSNAREKARELAEALSQL